MYSAIKDQLRSELDEIRAAGLYKTERHIDSPQANRIAADQPECGSKAGERTDPAG